MPTKRRATKRRPTDDPENWDCVFYCGVDYFNTLPFTSKEEAQAAAKAAWHRFGSSYMAQWTPERVKPWPWAHEQFGPPKGRR